MTSKDITLIFSKKPSNSNKKEAIRIAEMCNHDMDEERYFVHFTQPDNNLQKLLKLSRGWTTSKIIIDEEESTPRDAFNTFFCQEKPFCDGFCNHLHCLPDLDDIDVEDDTAYINKEYISEKWALEKLGPFLSKIDDNNFKLIKDRLKEKIKEDISFELKYCEKIDANKMLSLVDAFPNTISIVDSDEATEARLENAIEANMARYELQAEIMADIIAKRIEAVLDNYFPNKKKSNKNNELKLDKLQESDWDPEVNY
jgi:hypothetical protein